MVSLVWLTLRQNGYIRNVRPSPLFKWYANLRTVTSMEKYIFLDEIFVWGWCSHTIGIGTDTVYIYSSEIVTKILILKGKHFVLKCRQALLIVISNVKGAALLHVSLKMTWRNQATEVWRDRHLLLQNLHITSKHNPNSLSSCCLLLLHINALKYLDASFNQSSPSVNFVIVMDFSLGWGSGSSASSKALCFRIWKRSPSVSFWLWEYSTSKQFWVSYVGIVALA